MCGLSLRPRALPAASLLERDSPKRSFSIKMRPLCWRSQRLCTRLILGQNSPERWNAPKLNIAAANHFVTAPSAKYQKKFGQKLNCNPLKRKQLVISPNLAKTSSAPECLRTRGWDICFKLSCGFHNPPLRAHPANLYADREQVTVALARPLPHRFQQTTRPAKSPASPP